MREELAGIGKRVVAFHERGGEPPYVLYVYPPSDEWSVRRDLKDLRLWLEAPDQGIRCAAISLADLFWQALKDEGWIDELIEQERDAAGDESQLQDVYRAVGEILRVPPALPERVVAAVAEHEGERAAIFLYRAGALYPAYRTSTLVDEIRSRCSYRSPCSTRAESWATMA